MASSHNPADGNLSGSRRTVVLCSLAAVTTLAPAPEMLRAAAADQPVRSTPTPGLYGGRAGWSVAKDGTAISYKDRGREKPVVFSHGWPLGADAWDDQMTFMTSCGFRTVAFDRRGFGRSGQPWDGKKFDVFADDVSYETRLSNETEPSRCRR